MYNIGDDNELDRISREAANRYSPPANGADWQSLSSELDKVLPVEEEKKRRGFFFWWLLPVLLIGGGAAYWLMTDTTTIKTNDRANSTSAGPDKTNASTTTIKTDVQQLPNSGTNDAKDIAAVQGNTENATVETKARPDKINQQAVKNTTVNKQTGDVKADTRISKPNDQQAIVNPEITVSAPIVTKDKATEPEQKNNIEKPVQEIQQPVKENKAESIQEPVPSKTEEPKEPATTPLFDLTRGKGWSYSFLAGIDKSTVKFKYGNSPGINLGMIGGYHFNDRLSVHTGAIYTQKNYKVAGEDFTAPKGSWASYYKIDNVEGYCRMWEVPVLLRYNLGKPAKKNVFLSTGLSSYFMTKEDYTYQYYSNSGQLVTRHNEYSSSDTHIMSIADFSVGFENRLTKGWSLLVEPYAKIPLSGVGFGDIKLSSFGLNFSVQYRQPSKK